MFYAFKKTRNSLNTRVFNLSRPQSIEQEEKNYMYVEGDDIWEIADEVLDTLNPYIYTQFAEILSRRKDKESARVLSDIELAVVDIGGAEDYLMYAESVKGADVKLFQRAIIETKNAEKCYKFALNVPGADIEALAEAVYLYGSPRVWFDFAKNIPNANIVAFENATARYGSASDCYRFLENIPGADFDVLQKAIIESKDALVCLDLARNYKQADIGAIQNVIENCDNDSVKITFSERVAGANYETLFKKQKKQKKQQMSLSVDIDPEL